MITTTNPELKVDGKIVVIGNLYKFFGKFVLLKDISSKNKNWILTFVNKDKSENILFSNKTYSYNDIFQVIIPMYHNDPHSANYQYQKIMMNSLYLAPKLEESASNTIKHWMSHNKYRPGSKHVGTLKDNYYKSASKQYKGGKKSKNRKNKTMKKYVCIIN